MVEVDRPGGVDGDSADQPPGPLEPRFVGGSDEHPRVPHSDEPGSASIEEMVETNLCVCSHAREAHEHYRRGSDCGICGAEVCPRFRRAKARAVVQGSSPSTPVTDGRPAADREPVLRVVADPGGA